MNLQIVMKDNIRLANIKKDQVLMEIKKVNVNSI